LSLNLLLEPPSHFRTDICISSSSGKEAPGFRRFARDAIGLSRDRPLLCTQHAVAIRCASTSS
jgi:hypothetical protein